MANCYCLSVYSTGSYLTEELPNRLAVSKSFVVSHHVGGKMASDWTMRWWLFMKVVCDWMAR